jgi:hypothetical protein
MRILLAEPPRPFVLIDIRPGLKSLQRLVGGSIEYVDLGRPDAAAYVNEECLILRLMPNREANRLFRRDIGYGNLLCGPVVIVGLAGEADADVPPSVVDAVMRGVWPGPLPGTDDPHPGRLSE